MDKTERLQKLRDKIIADTTLPLRETATQLVFGEGDPNAAIYFLGEAPGRFEDLKGRPFVGQAGKLLDKLLAEIGLKRDEVYISNIVRFRPPANRDPKPEEIAAFLPYVDEEIEIIKPKVIVTLGRFSMNKFLPDAKISTVHGIPHPIEFKGIKVVIMPMYHPAAALRSGKLYQILKEDFLKIKSLI